MFVILFYNSWTRAYALGNPPSQACLDLQRRLDPQAVLSYPATLHDDHTYVGSEIGPFASQPDDGQIYVGNTGLYSGGIARNRSLPNRLFSYLKKEMERSTSRSSL